MTLITYRGRVVAMAGRECFQLAPHVGERPDGDPLKSFVCFLVLYARDVLTGELPDEPRRYQPARRALRARVPAPGGRLPRPREPQRRCAGSALRRAARADRRASRRAR